MCLKINVVKTINLVVKEFNSYICGTKDYFYDNQQLSDFLLLWCAFHSC